MDEYSPNHETLGVMIHARSDGHHRGSEFTLRLPTTSAPAVVAT
jgi:hypothetical protein